MNIGNWPPYFLDPVPEPDGLRRRITECEVALADARAQMLCWESETELRRIRAWNAYHDAHGWPDTPDYERRLRHAAGVPRPA